MTYHCKHCSFTWNSWESDFEKVLIHEKTHKKKQDDTKNEISM